MKIDWTLLHEESSTMYAYDVMKSTTTTCHYLLVTNHLLDPVKALAMEAEGLLKQHFVLYCPVIWERREVGQVCQGLFNVVLVPEEHAKSLLDTHTHSCIILFIRTDL